MIFWNDNLGFFIEFNKNLDICCRININWKRIGLLFDDTNRTFFGFWFFGIAIGNKQLRKILYRLIGNVYYTNSKLLKRRNKQ